MQDHENFLAFMREALNAKPGSLDAETEEFVRTVFFTYLRAGHSFEETSQKFGVNLAETAGGTGVG